MGGRTCIRSQEAASMLGFITAKAFPKPHLSSAGRFPNAVCPKVTWEMHLKDEGLCEWLDNPAYIDKQALSADYARQSILPPINCQLEAEKTYLEIA